MFPGGIEDPYPARSRYPDAARFIGLQTIGAARLICFQVAENPPVLQGSIATDIEHTDILLFRVGHKQLLLVWGERYSVRPRAFGRRHSQLTFAGDLVHRNG